MSTLNIEDNAAPLLVGAFKSVTDLADLILTDQQARRHLEDSNSLERRAFWRVFFQVALSPPFGPITPDLIGEEQPDLSWIGQIRSRYLQSEFVDFEQLTQYEKWCKTTSNRVMFMITNFWNADDERIPTAVVSHPGGWEGDGPESSTGLPDPTDAAHRWWSRAWALMRDINKLPYELQWNYSPHSIGTFVVDRSRQMKRSCPAFEMRVGPRQHYDQFHEFVTWLKSQPDQPGIGACVRRERSQHLLSMIPAWYAEKYSRADNRAVSKWLSEVFGFLEVPAKVVRHLVITPHPIPEELGGNSNPPSLDRRSLRQLLEHSAGLGTPSQAELIKTLTQPGSLTSEDCWSAWNGLETFLDYLGCFIVWRFYRDPYQVESPPQEHIDWEALQPSDAEMRLMLLNNLLLSPDGKASEPLAAHVSELAEAEQWDPTWFCHYCLPTWNKSASYLYVASEQPLSGANLICFQNLANHLIGLAWTHDSVRKQAEHRDAIIGNGERAARAAIMARNLSHNMGSHVLASINTRPDHGGVPEDIDAIFAFLQTRMDFIARVTTDPPVWDQPLYFIKDIILPLIFRLQVVVRNLVAAQWAGEIEFVIGVNNKTIPLLLKRDHPVSVAIPTDCAVMIPEGPCGAHAIYVLLENLLRNSVKYGEKAGKDRFQVHLALENDGPGYVSLRIWDNFGENRKLLHPSEDSSPRFLVDQMVEKYRSPLIDENTGRLNDVDWGVQEIVTCARFLMFPEDRTHSDCVTVQAVNSGGDKVANDTANSFLCTRILLKRPCFLAVVSESISVSASRGSVADGVEQFPSIADLSRSRAGYPMALIDMSVVAHWPKQLDDLAQFHQCLPYRLLAYTPDSLAGPLQIEFNKRAAGASIGANCVPERRVQVVAESVALPQPDATPADWEVFLLSLHAAWIARKYHGGRNPAKGMLIVSFERELDSPLFDRWKEQLTKVLPHAEAVNEVLNVAVLSTESNKVSIWTKRGDVPDPIVEGLRERALGTTVVYDNHDALLEKSQLTATPRMSTGNQTAKTFNVLAHPPEGAFAFNSFLLALYEAGLGAVVVIDERVAHAAMQIPSRFEKNGSSLKYRAKTPLHHDALNAANCYPQYSVRRAVPGGAAVHPICDSHALPNENVNALKGVAGDWVDRACLPIPPDEGVDLDDPAGGTLWCRPLVGSDGEPGVGSESRHVGAVKPDFVVIHQGLIDTLFRGVPEDAVREWFERLYRVAPVVVVTSGRGVVRKTRVLPNMPFVEFSVIKNALYPELCKPDLIATLASVKGVST